MTRNETPGSKASAGCQGQAGATASPEAVIQTHMLAFLIGWLYFIQHCSWHDTLNVCFRQSFLSSLWNSHGKLAAPEHIWEPSCDGEGGCTPGWHGKDCSQLPFVIFEHLWPFKAERFGFLVIISPGTCSTMHVISVAFPLDKWYIFDIKTGNSIHLSQSNMFLDTGCVGMSSSLGVCLKFLWLLTPVSPWCVGNSPRCSVCREQDPRLWPPLGDLGDRWLRAAADQCLHKESNNFQTLRSLNRAVWPGILSWSQQLFVNSLEGLDGFVTG